MSTSSKARGVTVHTIKGYGDTAVAEHAIALMVRGRARHRAHGPRSARRHLDAAGRRAASGKTLGVIGLGGIGREVARIGKGMGLEVIAYNRTHHADAAVPLVDIDTLLARPTWCRSISCSTTRRAAFCPPSASRA